MLAKIGLFVILFFITYRPYLSSTAMLRIGELISLLVAVFAAIIYYSFHKRISSKVFYSMVLIICITILSIFLPLIKQDVVIISDVIDPIRFLFPLFAFVFGAILYRDITSKLFFKFVIISVCIVFPVIQVIQYTNLLGERFDLIWNVENLVKFNRSSGFAINHVEPFWYYLGAISVMLTFNVKNKHTTIFSVIAIPFLLMVRSKSSLLNPVMFVFFKYVKDNIKPNIINIIKIFSLILLLMIVLFYIINSVKYFSNSFEAAISGDFKSDESIAMRAFDYILIFDYISKGELLLTGFGRDSSNLPESYMGTSVAMLLYRYGLLITIIYYFCYYKLISLWNHKYGFVFLFVIVFADSIANNTETLKGLFWFFFVIGYCYRVNSVK